MDGTIAKTLAKNEKVDQKLTFSGRFINIMMTLSIIKWVLVFGLISAIVFAAVEWSEFAPPIDLSIIGVDQLESVPEKSLEESLSEGFTTENIVSQAWTYPLILLIVLILPIVILYYQYYLRIANRYILTENRIIFKRGWLSTEVESIHYDHITDVLVKQSIWERFIFGTGKVFINTAGGEDYEAEMLHIKKPHHIKKRIYDLKNEYTGRRAKDQTREKDQR